jgi:MFS family permease
MPFSSNELGLSLSLVGLAWVVHSLAEALSRGIGGFLVQRIGFGAVGVLSGLVGLLALSGTILHPNGWFLLASMLLWGISISGLQPGYLSFASRIAVPGREGRAIAYSQFLVMPWIGLGWVLGTFFIKNLPENTPIVFFVALGLVTLLGLISLGVREPLPKQSLSLKQLLPVLIIVPTAFAQLFLQNLFNLVILKFTLTQLKFTEWQLYLAIGLAAVVVFLGAGVLGRLPDRKGIWLPLVTSLAALAAIFLLIAQRPSYPYFLLLCLLGGVAFATFVPSWNALLIRLLPIENRAAIWGSLMMVEGLGAATGPAVGGFCGTGWVPAAHFGVVRWCVAC